MILDDPGTFVKNEIEPIEPIVRMSCQVPQSGDDQTAESSADFAHGFDFEAFEQGA